MDDRLAQSFKREQPSLGAWSSPARWHPEISDAALRVLRGVAVIALLTLFLGPPAFHGEPWLALLPLAALVWYTAKVVLRRRGLFFRRGIDRTLPLLETLALTFVLLGLAASGHVVPLALILLYIWPLYRIDHLLDFWDPQEVRLADLTFLLVAGALLVLFGTMLLTQALPPLDVARELTVTMIWLTVLYGARLHFHRQVAARDSVAELRGMLQQSIDYQHCLERVVEGALTNPGANVACLYPWENGQRRLPLWQTRNPEIIPDHFDEYPLSPEVVVAHFREHGERCLFPEDLGFLAQRSSKPDSERRDYGIHSSVGIVLAPDNDDRDYLLGVFWLHFRIIERWDESKRRELHKYATSVAKELAIAQLRVAQLAQREARARHEERAKVVDDMHDDVQGLLNTANRQVDRILRHHAATVQPAALGDQPNTLRGIVEVARLIQDANANLRLFRLGLPTVGAGVSVGKFAEDLAQVAAIESLSMPLDGCPTLHFRGWEGSNCLPDGILPSRRPRVLEFYYVVKEALRNAIRHSNATEITVALACSAGEIEVTVEDNGDGYRPRVTLASGGGMAIMDRRTKELQGTLIVEALPIGGTRITCRCPVQLEGGEGKHGAKQADGALVIR